MGVSRDATPEQIKKAYKRLALRHHPDRIRGDEKAKAEASERFAQIAHAYEMLTRGPDESGQQQYGQYQPDAADMAAGFGGFGAGGRGFPQQYQQQPFVSPFMGSMMGGLGGGIFGGFGGMGDPFGSVFGGMSGGAFGGMGGCSPRFTDPFDLFRQVFGSDAMFGDSTNTTGTSGPHLAGSGILQSFMGGAMPMMSAANMQGGGNFTSFTYSSSASSGGVVGSGGMAMQSISTTTTIENGKTVTRTERTAINPDGTRHTVVDLTGDEMPAAAGEQSVPRRLTMDEKTKKKERKDPTTAAPGVRPPDISRHHHTHKRKIGEVTRCLKCCFPSIRKRRRLDPAPPARAA